VISLLQVACSKLASIPVYGMSAVEKPAIPVLDPATPTPDRRAYAEGVERRVALSPSHKSIDWEFESVNAEMFVAVAVAVVMLL
jgi:hypothetical protein